MQLPYIRERDVAARLGELLDHIYVPDGVAAKILETPRCKSGRSKREPTRALRRSAAATGLRNRISQAYEEKLNGKIDEGFWSRKLGEYRDQEHARSFGNERPDFRWARPDCEKIFELANWARFLYVTADPAGQGEFTEKML